MKGKKEKGKKGREKSEGRGSGLWTSVQGASEVTNERENP